MLPMKYRKLDTPTIITVTYGTVLVLVLVAVVAVVLVAGAA